MSEGSGFYGKEYLCATFADSREDLDFEDAAVVIDGRTGWGRSELFSVNLDYHGLSITMPHLRRDSTVIDEVGYSTWCKITMYTRTKDKGKRRARSIVMAVGSPKQILRFSDVTGLAIDGVIFREVSVVSVTDE